MLRHYAKRAVQLLFTPKTREMKEWLRLSRSLGAAPRSLPIEVDTIGYKLKIVDIPSFLSQFKEIFVDNIYRFTKAGDRELRIIECGANVGVSTLFFRHTYPCARITSIEADPDIFSVLRYNVRQNDMKGVELLEAAVWVDNDGLDFYRDGKDGGSSVVGHTSCIRVPSVDLKSLLSGEEHVDFLQMDIEGAETKVIAHCRDELHRVDFLFIEYHSPAAHPQLLGQLLEMLSEQGFRYYLETICPRKDRFALPPEQDGPFDYQTNIFCRNEKNRNNYGQAI